MRCEVYNENTQSRCSLEVGHREEHDFRNINPMLNAKKGPPARVEVDKCGKDIRANGETYVCQLDEGHEPPCSALSKEHTRLARMTLIARLTGILSHAWANAVMAEPDRWSPEEVDEATNVVRLLLRRAGPELIAEAHGLLKVSRRKS